MHNHIMYNIKVHLLLQGEEASKAALYEIDERGSLTESTRSVGYEILKFTPSYSH